MLGGLDARWRDVVPSGTLREPRHGIANDKVGEDAHVEFRFTVLFSWAFDGNCENCCLGKVRVAKTAGRESGTYPLRYRCVLAWESRQKHAWRIHRSSWDYGPFPTSFRWQSWELLLEEGRSGKYRVKGVCQKISMCSTWGK
jgi:hypothetical protein